MGSTTCKRPSITVADFFEAARGKLNLEIAAGSEGMKRRIGEAAINRPGLALTGFFTHFVPGRIQIIGRAEMAYLQSLKPMAQDACLRRLLEKKIACVIVTRRMRTLPALLTLAERVKTPVIMTPYETAFCVNTATILLGKLFAPRQTVQGTMVEINGMGVLLEGQPGMGKSEAALALIRMGHRLISDDVTIVRLDSAESLVATAPRVTRYHMEIRGLGIIHVPSLFGIASVRDEKRLDLVIHLTRLDRMSQENRSGQELKSRLFLGVSVPQIELPVEPGRDVARLVETAALDQVLKRLGHDAAKELDSKLIETLTTTMGGTSE